MDTPQDRVEHEIYITADLDAVWALISRPGWWINDGDVDPAPVLREEGDLVVLEHPGWGDFALQVVERDEPRYAAYRWAAAPLPEPGPEGTGSGGAVVLDEATTLVELWLEERVGGVMLKVAESGFTQLSDDPEIAARARESNAEGWSNELKAARAFTTRFRG